MSNGEEKKVEKKEGEEKVEKKEGRVVTLTEEQYGQLLDRIAELEERDVGERPRRGKEDEVYDLDELAEEGKKVEKPSKREVTMPTAEEVDNMTNTQLLDFIAEQGDIRFQDLNVKIETLKVMREIDKAEGKYEDFWKYEKDIRRVASENPTLSIDRAYKLVKLDKGEQVVERGKGKKKEGEEEEEVKVAKTKTEKILRLPPRVASGEKPGVASRSTKGSEIKTLKEASNKAWDEVMGGGEEET